MKLGKEVALIFFVDNKGRILFYQRDHTEGITYPGKWSLIGGVVEDKENFDNALTREVKEELGHGFVSRPLGYRTTELNQKLKFYSGILESGFKRETTLENLKLKWFTTEQVICGANIIEPNVWGFYTENWRKIL